MHGRSAFTKAVLDHGRGGTSGLHRGAYGGSLPGRTADTKDGIAGADGVNAGAGCCTTTVCVLVSRTQQQPRMQQTQQMMSPTNTATATTTMITITPTASPAPSPGSGSMTWLSRPFPVESVRPPREISFRNDIRPLYYTGRAEVGEAGFRAAAAERKKMHLHTPF